jgi:hypothetical protein
MTEFDPTDQETPEVVEKHETIKITPEDILASRAVARVPQRHAIEPTRTRVETVSMSQRRVGMIASSWHVNEKTTAVISESFDKVPPMISGEALLNYIPPRILTSSAVGANLARMGVDNRILWSPEHYLKYVNPPFPSGIGHEELKMHGDIESNLYYFQLASLDEAHFPEPLHPQVRLTQVPSGNIGKEMMGKLLALRQLLFWQEGPCDIEDARHILYRMSQAFAVHTELDMVLGYLFYGLKHKDFFSEDGQNPEYQFMAAKILEAADVLEKDSRDNRYNEKMSSDIEMAVDFLKELSRLFCKMRKEAFVFKGLNLDGARFSMFDCLKEHAQSVQEMYSGGADFEEAFQNREKNMTNFITDDPNRRVYTGDDYRAWSKRMSGMVNIRRELTLLSQRKVIEAIMKQKGVLPSPESIKVISLQEAGSFENLINMYLETLEERLGLLDYEEGTGKPQLTIYLDDDFLKKKT